MGQLELNKELTVWRDLLLLTRPLVSTGINSAIKVLQILSDEESRLGRTNSEDKV
jgi:hypothetical protein